MRAGELHRIWIERHGEEWSEAGASSSARSYAYTVVQHRLGERASLSFGYYVGQGHDDRANRKAIREQIDAILEDAAISESIKEGRAEAAREEFDHDWEPPA